ncbi:MAG: 2Fe-2S iron-sulfur cluster-binding protein, partial [Gammaproteobacteria bacterium]
MSYSVLIQPSGLRFTAQAGRSLLRAAEDAGAVLPSSCRNGTCR